MAASYHKHRCPQEFNHNFFFIYLLYTWGYNSLAINLSGQRLQTCWILQSLIAACCCQATAWRKKKKKTTRISSSSSGHSKSADNKQVQGLKSNLLSSHRSCVIFTNFLQVCLNTQRDPYSSSSSASLVLAT